jgi:type 1 glutamine amidotransferase
MNGIGKTIIAAALALGAEAALAQTFPNVPPTTDGTTQSAENVNYGVCRGTDPGCYHNWGVARQKKVLLFTRTAGPRHASLGTVLAAGVNPPLGANNNTQADMVRLLDAEGIAVDYTETVTNLSNLNQYMAVIFFSNSRDVLFDHGRAVNPALAVSTTTSAYLDQAKVLLRQYMRAGGGFVAVHNAHGTEYNWPWYEGLLGNSNYYDHGNFQPGVFEIVSSDSSTDPLGAPGTRVNFSDEWYNLVPFPTGVKFLATVDESTLATKRSVHPGFPSFHPVAWCQYYDGGRAWITTLGHDRRATQDVSLAENQPGGANFFAGAAEFQTLLVNGVKSAMGLQPFCEAYAFSGFGGVTTANAGNTVQVKFGVGGNQGANPVVSVTSAQSSCSSGLPMGTVETGRMGGGMSYDRGKGQYHFNWRTERSWSGMCRQLSVMLDDGTIHTAQFQFE